ncbi:MAG: hypothetical protein OQK25_03715, partial [Gammaproteobacteria bacterium]|nr:hypothetical protein [Gammaproteobacteria bacterium]
MSFPLLASGNAVAEQRPWGVITPMGEIAADQRGFQGRYNPWGGESSGDIEDSSQQIDRPKRVRQGWQNIYR